MNKIDIIYHYTTVRNSINIIQSGKLWACDSRYLNDANELVMATKLFGNMIKDKYRINIDHVLYLNNSTRSYCVSCFSESPKILSQWRSYANDGRGLCLGFSKSFFEHGRSGQYQAKLVKCVYDNHPGFIDHLIENNADDIDNILSLAKDMMVEENIDCEKNRRSLDNVYIELLRIKNKNFSEEMESRFIVCVPTIETKKLVNNEVIIPYIEHSIFSDENDIKSMWCAIPQIWLGPKCDKRNEDAIKSFMQLGWLLNSEHGFGTYKFDCGYR